jgi:hypothetical protein
VTISGPGNLGTGDDLVENWSHRLSLELRIIAEQSLQMSRMGVLGHEGVWYVRYMPLCMAMTGLDAEYKLRARTERTKWS